MRRPEADYYLLFNEGAGDLKVRLKLAARGRRSLLDPVTGHSRPVTAADAVSLARQAMSVLAVRQG